MEVSSLAQCGEQGGHGWTAHRYRSSNRRGWCWAGGQSPRGLAGEGTSPEEKRPASPEDVAEEYR